MSHTISVRLDDELHDDLTAIASVTGERLSDVVRDMLRESVQPVLSSPDFHAKLAVRQAALLRLAAYAPEPEPEEGELTPPNGAGPGLASAVE